jgi:thiol-disulfide isomerase/thioredoxin
MKYSGFGFVAVFAIMVLFVCSGFPTGSMAAGSVRKINESKIDAKISNRESRLALVFMAAWCAPCIDELPTLNKLHRKYKSRGLEIIGISIDLEGPGAMQPVVNKIKIDFPIYWYGEKAIEKFALFAIPMMLLVKEGEIVERIHGRRTESFLSDKFTDFLK